MRVNEQVRRFGIAVTLLTKIPFRQFGVEKGDIARASGYFPIVGAILGGIAWLLFSVLMHVTTAPIAIFIMLLAITYLTGGFHEDGVADVFDACGLPRTRRRTLEIMKDSRIGSYGSLGLIFLVLGKFLFLTEIDPAFVPHAFAVALVIGRWSIIPLLRLFPYLGNRKKRNSMFNFTSTDVSWITIAVSSAFSFGFVFLLFPAGAYAILSAVLVMAIAGAYFKKRIGGITGDCAGTVEQVVEFTTLFVISLV